MASKEKQWVERSGKERRRFPPQCTMPCKPIVEELDKRSDKVVKEIDKRDEIVLVRLEKLDKCVNKLSKDKAPINLVYKIVGAFAFFGIVVIGTMQWKTYHSTNDIKVDVSAIKVNTSNTKSELESHIRWDNTRHDKLRDEVNELYRKKYWLNDK
jgi:hypothetical protein